MKELVGNRQLDNQGRPTTKEYQPEYFLNNKTKTPAYLPQI